MIQLNCNVSLSTTLEWKVKNCTSTNCSFQIVLNSNVITTLSELYIPSKTFAYGIYELILTVIMTDAPRIKSSSIAYVRIIPSDITVNLLQAGTSMITLGTKQNLLLNPGSFSIDPDANSFDPSVSI